MIVYGVAMISRLLKIVGLVCKRALWKRRYSAKETYNFREPTNHSHPVYYHISRLLCHVHHLAHCNTLQHTATHCNTLQHNMDYMYRRRERNSPGIMSAYHTVTLWDFCFVTHCNKLQHTATHTARQSATHCNSHCKTICNTLQLTLQDL